MVPCSPVEYLNAEYGVNSWQEPKKALSKSAVSITFEPKKAALKKNEYKWPNLKFYRNYTDDEAFNVRWYFQNSSIDYGTNIGYINRRLSNKLNEMEIRGIIDKEPIIYWTNYYLQVLYLQRIILFGPLILSIDLLIKSAPCFVSKKESKKLKKFFF